MPHAAQRLAFFFFLFIALPGLQSQACAGFRIEDDAGQTIVFEQPVRRIVSLAPHITELLFAAGAGSRVIAADEYSDYPQAARELPRIGNAYALDLETLLALKPDLVIAWNSGNDARQVARLRGLGIRVFLSEPRTLDDIPRAIELFGRLAGTETAAQAAAAALRTKFAKLAARYSNATPVRVFYEIWSPPVMTINGSHLIDAVLRLCRGRNVFAAVGALTPTVTGESVVAANPEVIIASGTGDAKPAFLDAWLSWPRISAVQRGLVTWIPGDLIDRPGPRIIDGATQACGIIDRARANALPGNKQP
jgi:iron complex transport system substrate-binding protein